MIIPLKGGHSFDSAAMGQCSSHSSRWRGDVHGRVHLPQICLWGQVRRVVVTGSQTSGQRRLDVNVRVVTVSHGRSLSSKGIFQKNVQLFLARLFTADKTNSEMSCFSFGKRVQVFNYPAPFTIQCTRNNYLSGPTCQSFKKWSNGHIYITIQTFSMLHVLLFREKKK